MAGVDLLRDELPGADLHRFLAELRSQGTVAEVPFAGERAWIVLGYEALLEAFRDDRAFPAHEAYRLSIEPLVGRNFQSMEGEEHRVFRALATPAFRSRAVERYERRAMEALAHELIDRLAAAPAREVDLAEAFTHRFPFLVITRMLGIPREAEARFHGWAVEMLAYRHDPARAIRARDEFTRYLAPVLAERRREPQDDVLSELAAAEVEGRRLDDEQIFAHARLLFAAGATTTHDGLGSLLWALLAERERWERLRAEPELRRWAIEETLRWEPPVAVLPRRSGAAPVELAGAGIEPASWVLFAIAAANRDPAVHAEPDRFDLGRRPTEILTFGRGLRSCPGMHLARKEMAVALGALLERLPELRLLDEPAARPRGATVRGPRRLPVALGRVV